MLLHRLTRASISCMRGYPTYNPKMVALTPEQVNIIKTTWEIPAKDPMGSGEEILFRYFDKYPEYQDKFDSFRNVPVLSLKGTPGFRTHAGRIMTVFQNSIDQLDQPDGLQNIKKIWNLVGNNHARRSISRKAFEDLRGIILEVLTEACKLDKTHQEAWIILMDTVYSIVFEKIEK